MSLSRVPTSEGGLCGIPAPTDTPEFGIDQSTPHAEPVAVHRMRLSERPAPRQPTGAAQLSPSTTMGCVMANVNTINKFGVGLFGDGTVRRKQAV